MLLGVRAAKLQIDWLEEGQARQVTAGLVDLEVEAGPDAISEIVLDIFPDDYSWLGLQVPKGVTPHWIAPGGSRPFRSITASDGAIWWVPTLGWNSAKRRHENAFLRGMGQFDLSLGDQSLRVVTRHHGSVRLEDYLRDFHDELIWLVLGQEGMGGVSRGGGDDVAGAYKAFVEAVAPLVQNLPRELREQTGDMRRSRVRPNAATFRALGRTPQALVLPGRLTSDEADIPDNRYLRHMIQTALVLAKAVGGASREQAEALLRRAEQLGKAGRELATTEWQEVDPEVFDAQLADLETRMNRISSWRPDPAPEPDETSLTRGFKIGNSYRNSSNKFLCWPYDQRWHRDDAGRKVDFWVVELPNKVASIVEDSQQFEREFAFQVPPNHFKPVWKDSIKGKYYCEFQVGRVLSIRPRRTALENRRDLRERLAVQGWRLSIDAKTRKEYRQAGRVFEARTAHVRLLAKGADCIAGALSQGSGRLSRLEGDLAAAGVGISTAPPDGLRWRLHPPHVACLAALRRLQASASAQGLDLGALERLDRIGTLHASALYERWCLVKILTVLINDYRLQPPQGWQGDLVDSLTRPDGTITFHLSRPDLRMAARLEVQPLLPNGRRPDFRLRVAYLPLKASASVIEELFEQAPGLIMDAKFRSRWKAGEIEHVVDGLLRQKGYDASKDKVFVLQPCGGTIRNPTSPLSWGRHCDYGQDQPDNHAHGHIWLAPDTDRADPQTHLRRLITHYLQSRFARPCQIMPSRFPDELDGLSEKATFGTGGGEQIGFGFKETENYVPFSASFCIVCGKAHGLGDVEREFTGSSRNRREYWILTCSDCRMTVTRTHCYSCPDTVLFKNHLHLTYHRTVAHQPTHVVCPCCGAYFDEKSMRQEGRFGSSES